MVRISHHDGNAGWMITGHAVTRDFLADERFSARSDLRRFPLAGPGGDMRVAASPGQFTNMDRPDHSRYHRVLAKYFTKQRLRVLTPAIEGLVTDRISAIRELGPPTDLVTAFAMTIPSLALSELIGIPPAHRKFVEQLSTGITTKPDTETRSADVVKLVHYVGRLVRHRRQVPGDDTLTAWMADPAAFTDDEMIQLVVTVILGGHETTSNMISLGVFALAEHPAELARMLADPASDDTAVDELLRYLSITQVGVPCRAALADIELAGQPIRKDDTVSVALSVVNRDPEVFAHPDRLDVRRPDAHRHLSFGYGVHKCLGAQFAKLVLRIAYRGLFEGLPGLRLAVPAREIPMRTAMSIYGPERLPVTWG
ncbi:cytochrome P450 [Nocardia sp. NPDC055053]